MPSTHLTLQERYVIHHLLLFGLSMREIARRLDRAPSTLSREVRRNGRVSGPYWHECAEAQAQARRKQARHYRKRSDPQLVRYVEHRLKIGWSPELIAGRLQLDSGDDPLKSMSHEGIYRWIYRDAQQGGDLYTCLLSQRPKRRKQRQYASLRGRIPGRVGIEQRPDIVHFRQRFGDWESDTLEGAKGKGGLATHVERKSRYLVVAKLDNRKADTFTQGSLTAFRAVPRALRQTLTADNGKEFSHFRELENKGGFTVYFADPYSAWQRGTNENSNGLLRRYFPKGTNFHQVSDQTVARVVKKLNNRPRKCLGYRTPQEIFSQAKRVALRS